MDDNTALGLGCIVVLVLVGGPIALFLLGALFGASPVAGVAATGLLALGLFTLFGGAKK